MAFSQNSNQQPEKIPLQSGNQRENSQRYTYLESGEKNQVKKSFRDIARDLCQCCTLSDRSKGILLAMTSGAFFTMCTAIVKLLKHLDPREILAIRGFFQAIIALVVACFLRVDVRGPSKFRPLLTGQGIIGGLTLSSLFFALHHMPVGDASALIFSSPVLVMVFGSLFLREPFTLFRLAVLITMVTGGIFIARPSGIFGSSQIAEQTDPWGVASALAATTFYSINYILTRKLKEVHCLITLFYFSGLAMLVALIWLSAFGKPTIPTTASDWGLLTASGFLGCLGQGLLALALQYEGAGTVSLTRSLDIVLAYVFQVTLFHEIPGWLSIVGAVLVVLCVGLIGFEPVIVPLIPHSDMNLCCLEQKQEKDIEDADYAFTDSEDILSHD